MDEGEAHGLAEFREGVGCGGAAQLQAIDASRECDVASDGDATPAGATVGAELEDAHVGCCGTFKQSSRLQGDG